MAILKSEIVGKSIDKLPSSLVYSLHNDSTTHKIWTRASTKVIDFLAHCTLRYAKSYGASYKIDPTSELTIIHTDGTKYSVDSYKKLLTMVITDYDEPTGATVPTNTLGSVSKYLDREPQDGDYAERIKSPRNYMPLGFVSRVTASTGTIRFLDQRGRARDLSKSNFKVINPEHPSHPNYLEQPMSAQPQPGTHWERLQYFTADSPKGEIITVNSVSSDRVAWYGPLGHVTRPIDEFEKLFKPRPDLDIPTYESTSKRGLAFYKESGRPWTYEEYVNISEYCGDKPPERRLSRFSKPNKHKYVYDDDDKGSFMCDWDACKPEEYPENYTILSYESVFDTPTKSTKTTEPKPKPVAQPEPITPTPIKETFMSKIKDSASATVDQNKQALVIASKMEAGRIINKQVLKQLAPHLPFFLQGYAKSPFAPFVAANLVAMVANHTGNSKLTKVSDLMLLGAADSGVAAFNLDKIVDDILSNIKLPAGVLDDSDEE